MVWCGGGRYGYWPRRMWPAQFFGTGMWERLPKSEHNLLIVEHVCDMCAVIILFLSSGPGRKGSRNNSEKRGKSRHDWWPLLNDTVGGMEILRNVFQINTGACLSSSSLIITMSQWQSVNLVMSRTPTVHAVISRVDGRTSSKANELATKQDTHEDTFMFYHIFSTVLLLVTSEQLMHASTYDSQPMATLLYSYKRRNAQWVAIAFMLVFRFCFSPLPPICFRPQLPPSPLTAIVVNVSGSDFWCVIAESFNGVSIDSA